MLSRRLLRIKIVKALYSHFLSGEDSISRSEKELKSSLAKSYELYLLFVHLIVELADVAVERIEKGRSKLMPTEQDLHPNMRFAQNRVVQKIRESAALADALEAYGAGWRRMGQGGVIKKLYGDFVQTAYYRDYMEGAQLPGFAEDRQLIIDLLTYQIEDNPYLEEALEEESILWIDDIGYALALAIRTIGYLTEQSEDLTIQPMYRNEDDREFVDTLFRKALESQQTHFEYIDRFAQNWDFDRMAFMDKLIMLAAITELVEFESIPVKVSLDEYIEISKYYSTQGSSTFVNGVLDKVVSWLTEQGSMQKSGRGLMEANKKKKAVSASEDDTASEDTTSEEGSEEEKTRARRGKGRGGRGGGSEGKRRKRRRTGL